MSDNLFAGVDRDHLAAALEAQAEHDRVQRLAPIDYLRELLPDRYVQETPEGDAAVIGRGGSEVRISCLGHYSRAQIADVATRIDSSMPV